MNGQLDIHRASDSERIEAYRNVHEMWGGALSMDEHLRRRLASPQHDRADWYVGCLQGRVVTSLGCYPHEFLVAGTRCAGMAIGAVYTVPEQRGRGYASRLIEWVEADWRREGARLSLLYSDIPPAYYERLGYVLCPGWEVDIKAAETSDAARRQSPVLQIVSPREQSRTLAELYQRHCEGLAFCIARDESYWDYLLAKQPDDEFYLLVEPSAEPIAYVRMRFGEDCASIHDVAFRDPDQAPWDVLMEQVVGVANDRSVSTIAGWLPNLPAIRAFGEVRPRQQELAMLKPLDDALRLSETVIGDAQHLVEIDHV